jgi:hypothetical protein
MSDTPRVRDRRASSAGEDAGDQIVAAARAADVGAAGKLASARRPASLIFNWPAAPTTHIYPGPVLGCMGISAEAASASVA